MTTVYPGLPGLYGTPPPAPVPPVAGPWLPRWGEPGWSVWSRRLWPIDPLAAAPRGVVLLALVAGVVGTSFWRISVLRIGYPLVGLLVFGVVFGTAERRPTRGQWFGMVSTTALLTVPALLAAPWLGGLCIVAAWLVGWCTLVGGRTWTAVLVGPFVPWLALARTVGWTRRSMPEGSVTRAKMPSATRVFAVAAVTILLVLVFGGLFASADPAFGRLIDGLVPQWNAFEVAARTAVFAIVVGFILLGGHLLRFAPRLDAMAPKPMRPVPNWEWAVPLAVLDVLFIGFVAVQAAVLFGGHAHVLETEGLTYAEYARQGFWQLLWVSALTMLVLAGVIRIADRRTVFERRLLRVLVGILCATSIVVVISAIHRMWVYQQAYGFSIERILVITVELWLGAVFVMIAAAGITMSGRWLPRAVLFAGALALLGLAATNPERLIAERNVDRYERTGELDTAYLLRLSPDVEPALQRLPEEMRACAKYRDDDPDPWYAFNLSRWTAPHGPAAGYEECDEYWERTSR